MALDVGDFMLTALVGVPAVVALRERFLPLWVAWLGVLLAAAWAVAGSSILVTEGAFAPPNGP